MSSKFVGLIAHQSQIYRLDSLSLLKTGSFFPGNR